MAIVCQSGIACSEGVKESQVGIGITNLMEAFEGKGRNQLVAIGKGGKSGAAVDVGGGECFGVRICQTAKEI